MYEIYQTRAYILRSHIIKESDQRILVFSEDFGLIWVNASGSKKEKSKFRNFLQPLSKVKIFLVSGRGGYRITGGEFLENFYFLWKGREEIFKDKILVLKNIFLLLERVFFHGEPDQKIFSLLESFLNSLEKIKDKKVLKEKEVLFLSKLFYLWGYFDKNELLEKVDFFSIKQEFSEEEIKKLREKINENISKIAF